jgi:hypothetical protein
VLLVRRHRYTGKLSFYRCWTPEPVTLSRLIAIAVIRWRIEEDHQLAKQAAGLDAGQVIRWKSWHRWTAVCLLAYIYLAVAVALQRQQDTASDLAAGLIPITVPELLRLLRGTVIPPPRQDRIHRLHWSTWRRAAPFAASAAPHAVLRRRPRHHPALPGRTPCPPLSTSRQVVPVSPCSLRGLLLPHVSREFDGERRRR